MIVVRNVFRLKYGQARPALALFKDMNALMKKLMPGRQPRLLTDLVGPAYTMVLEDTYPSLAEVEQDMKKVFSHPEWHALYEKFTPLVDSGYREVFTIVEI